MNVKKIFGKSEQSEPGQGEEYVELDFGEEKPSKNVIIEVEKIVDFADTDRIIRKVREGNLLLVKIKDLKNKDVTELKRAIEKVRKTTLALDGDIAGVGDEWLIVTPSFARVRRESATA